MLGIQFSVSPIVYLWFSNHPYMYACYGKALMGGWLQMLACLWVCLAKFYKFRRGTSLNFTTHFEIMMTTGVHYLQILMFLTITIANCFSHMSFLCLHYSGDLTEIKDKNCMLIFSSGNVPIWLSMADTQTKWPPIHCIANNFSLVVSELCRKLYTKNGLLGKTIVSVWSHTSPSIYSSHLEQWEPKMVNYSSKHELSLIFPLLPF